MFELIRPKATCLSDISNPGAFLKKPCVVSLLCGAFFLSPCTGLAEFHGTLTATNNNVGRWFSKSDNDFALLANLDYEHPSGLYFGSSVSTIRFETDEIENDAARVEITPYLGWTFSLSSAWRLDAQWTRYLYDGDVFGHPADYNEFYLFLHYQDMFSGRISFAEDYYGLGDYAIDYELTGRYPLTDYLELSAGIGYGQTKAVLGSDYPYWNAGFTCYYKFVSLDFRYRGATETSTDPSAFENTHQLYDPPLIDAAFVFTVSAGF
ncbi:MAG: TorF family putative porin [Gammaproteobacteria bacterium]